MTPSDKIREELKRLEDRLADGFKHQFIERGPRLLSALTVAIEALDAISENTLELQPNSGHMYLANVNYCYKKTREATDTISKILRSEG